MTVFTIAEDSARLHDMGDDDADDNTGQIGPGQAPAIEPDFRYQGDNSISKKAGTSLSGISALADGFSPDRTTDMTVADRGVWFCKLFVANPGSLEPIGQPGLNIRLGSTNGADYYEWDAAGGDVGGYPARISWLIIPFNPNSGAYQSDVNGTPDLTGVMYFATATDFNAMSQGQNLAMDAIDVGIGLTAVGGTSTDPEITLNDMLAYDEGVITNRFGFFSSIDGVIFCVGRHWFGRDASATSAATELLDSFFTVVFPDGPFDEGDAGFSFDNNTAGSSFQLSNGSIISRGTGNRALFNTEDDVNATTDAIGGSTNNLWEKFNEGDCVTITALRGTETPGPSADTSPETLYWVGYDINASPLDTGAITLHTDRNSAMLRTSPVALTASTAGNGEVWRIDKHPDTRSELSIDGTTGDGVTFTGVNLLNIGAITLNADFSLIGCFLDACRTITQDSGPITDCTISNATTFYGEAYITTSDLGDISGTSFTSAGLGHAADIDTAGTYAFSANLFSDYFAVTNQDLHRFDNTSDVSASPSQITLPTGHGYTTGDPVVYSREITANTALTGLTDQTLYYVNVSGDNVSLHLNQGDAINDNSPIILTVGTGNETHALWPANAAIHNSSGGLVTLNLSDSGDIPSIRNGLDSTTVINNAVTLRFEVTDTDGNPISNALCGLFVHTLPSPAGSVSVGDEIMSETPAGVSPQVYGVLTDASGIAQNTGFNFDSGPIGVSARVRKSSPVEFSPQTRFIPFRQNVTVTSTGITIFVTLAEDTIASV